MCNVFREDMWITIFWTVRNIVPFHSNKWKLFCPNFYWIFPVICVSFLSRDEAILTASVILLHSLVKSPVEEARLSWLMYGTRRWMRLSGDLLYTLALVDGDWSTILNMESEEAHRAVQDFQAIVVLKHNWCTWHFSAPGVEHVFVLKASPVTYLFWIWLILPYIVPWTRIRMLPHGQCSNPGESLVPLNVIHIYVE